MSLAHRHSESPIRAVLFDLDCTLTDRRRSITAAVELIWRTYDTSNCCAKERFGEITWVADNWGYCDRRQFFMDIVERANWRSAPPIAELLRFWREDYPSCAVAHDDAVPLLRALKERELATGLITNGDATSQQGKIDQLGLEPYLDATAISGALGIEKPSREIFEFTLRRLGLPAAQAVFVGDHPINDVAGAQAAGLRAVWLAGMCEFPSDQPPAWRSVQRPGELLPIVDAHPSPIAVLSSRECPL